MIRLGVTGTDTGVGKTVIAAGITAWLRARGLNAAAMKPIETGGGSDAEILRSAAGSRDELAAIAPVRFSDPLAPAVAARLSGTPVSLESLDRDFQSLALGRDAIVVEGAGGLLVPITDSFSYADLIRRWELPTLIVAPNRLGMINHTLLTVAAARAADLRIAAIVVNEIPGHEDDFSRASNAGVIAESLRDLKIISFPIVANAGDISRIAACVESSGLGALILGLAAH